MIISASRRTDIPAFYATWLIQRIRAGYCTVPNPFNRQQVTRISLAPEDVDVIVFWTRNPRPLFPYLGELDDLGYRYYFHYTLMNNPAQIDPKSPPMRAGIAAFQELARMVGPERVIWRYDPIVFTPLSAAEFHIEQYRQIAEALQGCTRRSVISVMDNYAKAGKRLQEMAAAGAPVTYPDMHKDDWFRCCIQEMVAAAGQYGMNIYSCAEELELARLGVRPGKCVDDDYIHETFGLTVGAKKDPNQRKLCGCVLSKDIGMYDSCLFGCRYCYATQSFETAKKNHANHQPDSPSLIGWYE